MSRQKERKLRRLKRGHIWPSILFVLFSMLLSFVVFSVFTSLILTYFAQDRLKTNYDHMLSISRMLSEEADGERDAGVLNGLEGYQDLTDAVYLLDGTGKILAGFGGATYELEKAEILSDNQDFIIYADRDAKYQLFSDGEINIDSIRLEQLKLSNVSSAFEVLSFHEKNVLYEDVFWLGMPLSGSRTLLVKSRIYFYDKDIFLAFAIGILSFAAMFLPILFLFANVVSNVSKQRRITSLLYADQITKGNSWTYFEHYADRSLCRRGNANKLFSVIDITLMKYRSYCSFHGVEEGERLLGKIDRRLAEFAGKGGCSALYGKSSYGLFMKCKSREECESSVQALLKQLSESLGHDGMVFHAGICFLEPVSDEKGRYKRRVDIDIAEAYNRASAARASITDENVNAAAVFDRKLLDDQLWEHKVGENMQKALDKEEFQVYLQPKYNPVTEQLVGAEALVRWINEEEGFISPGRFIPIFEKNGFITKLDDYMLSHVAELQAKWLEQGKDVVPVSVNVSRAHFADPDLAGHICRLIDQYQVPHHLIEIELTESAFFDDKAALLNTVQALKQAGFAVSMDDFGAGYSSLNSLKDLPLDVLKLDAEFFRGEDEQGRGEIVVSQVIRLAKQLHMRIVAEGIEKKEQVDFLAAQNCDMIQGFYYAKPMPATEYEERMGEK